MICKKCGRENKDNAKYCGGCGAKLKKKSKIKLYFLIGGVMLVALYLNNELMKKLEPMLYGRSSQEETKHEENNEAETDVYKLNETFEIGSLTFDFTKTFASAKYEFWETTDKDNNVLAGFEGTVQNNSSASVSLSDLDITIYYIDGKGNKQQTNEPKTEFYSPSYADDWSSTSTIVGAGQSGTVYMFLTPDRDCNALEMVIEDPTSNRKVTVRNTFYCEGSYENEDATSFLRAAKGYQENLACVQFYMDEKEYFGYIDKEGKMKFYFPAKQEDDICYFPTDFDNGYIQYKYGETSYIIDKNGNIRSQYGEEGVSYGAGYTWIESDISGFDEAGYKDILYTPDGEIETEITSDKSVEIEYLGNGIFLYDDDDEEVTRKYYFSKIHKWVDSYGDEYDIKVNGEWLYDGLYQDYELRKKYFTVYNSEGESMQVNLPDDIYNDQIYVCDMSDKYIFFLADSYGSERILYIYDLTSKEFRSYSGKYADKVQKKDNSQYILNDSLIVSMQGEDEKNYIGFISIKDLTEIGEPIQFDSFEVGSDVVSVWTDSSEEQQIYDSEGNLLYTLTESSSLGWLGGFSENTMVTGYTDFRVQEDDEVEENNYNQFMDYEGNTLFDSIDYNSAKEISL